MKATGRIELPPSFIHRIRRVNKFEKELVCEGFRLSNQFPNNIAVLTGQRVLYCVSFAEEKEEGSEHASRFFMSGFIFDTLKPQWWQPGSSFRLGNYHAFSLNLSTLATVTGMELTSKAFIFPRGPDTSSRPFPATDPLPTNVQPLIRQYQSMDVADDRAILLESIKILGKRFKNSDPGYLLDYWWVNSLVIPGRYTNHFQ